MISLFVSSSAFGTPQLQNEADALGPPGVATLVSPSGTISDTTPTYTWNVASDVTWYRLFVREGSAGSVYDQWYKASELSCGVTCSVTPNVTLNSGNHTWWVQTWNANGYGPWSAEMNFTVTGADLPDPTTLVSPSGVITDTTPRYTWKTVPEATWYRLYVREGNTGSVHDQWYRSSEVTEGVNCLVTPETALNPGDHTWWVQTWNSNGYGPWSASLDFTVNQNPPGKATLVSPSGTIGNTTPSFTWNAVAEATYYRLYVQQGSSNPVIDRWYDASDVTSGSTCTASPGKKLNLGDHTWWVQTWNPIGIGPWSDGVDFKISTLGQGFNEQFNSGNAANWDRGSGDWNVIGNKWYYTQGVVEKAATSTYKEDGFTNFTYQAKLWRYGSNEGTNILYIRASEEIASDFGLPSNCYAFEYTRSGQFSVWKIIDGKGTYLQPWTSSAAIAKDDAWNVLRVYANGNSLQFYINGSLVWQGEDNEDDALSSGRVGVGMYRDESSANNQLYVDWASLNVVQN
jgi:hypothetical protein